jgi:hypothetical protein
MRPESVWLTALTLTVAGAGGTDGALYIPDGLMVPEAESPPMTPFTDQVTAVVEIPEIDALNCCVQPTGTKTGEGVTESVGPGDSLIPQPWTRQDDAIKTAKRNRDSQISSGRWFNSRICTIPRGKLASPEARPFLSIFTN